MNKLFRVMFYFDGGGNVVFSDVTFGERKFITDGLRKNVSVFSMGRDKKTVIINFKNVLFVEIVEQE